MNRESRIKSKKILRVLAMTALFIPAGLIFAQTTVPQGVDTTPKNLTELVNRAINILNYLVPWVIVGSGAIFMYGFIAYIGAGGNEEKLKDGKKRIYFGFFALFIVMSFWGIAYLLKTSFFGV